MAEYLTETTAAKPQARLLIVEDDPTVRDFCRLLLRLHYTVATAPNGRVAVEMLGQERYDLVLADMQMPEMGGMALLQYLREHFPDVDAVMFTAHATVETARQALKLGAFDYLSKPIDANDLERTVRKCLELRRIRKEKERLSELLVMYQFSQAIGTSLDIDTQVFHMTEFLWQRFAPETLAISLSYPDEQRLVLLFYKTRNTTPSHSGATALDPACDERQLIGAHMHLVGLAAEPSGFLAGAVLRTHAHPIGYVHLTRNPDQPEFDINERRLLSVFASQIAASLDNARLYQQLKEQNWQTIEALAEAIDARDAYTLGHSQQVTHYAVRLAEKLGLAPERIELLRYAGLLHDIGKIGIRDYILLKPGPLSSEEAEIMQKHPYIGAKIISKVRALQAALPIIEGHHEQVDGKGYPAGKTADELPLEARILAIADAFEAMTADRAYRVAMDTETALQILIEGSSIKWDAWLVGVFVELIRDEGPTLRITPRLKQNLVPLLKPHDETVAVRIDARD